MNLMYGKLSAVIWIF